MPWQIGEDIFQSRRGRGDNRCVGMALPGGFPQSQQTVVCCLQIGTGRNRRFQAWFWFYHTQTRLPMPICDCDDEKYTPLLSHLRHRSRSRSSVAKTATTSSRNGRRTAISCDRLR